MKSSARFQTLLEQAIQAGLEDGLDVEEMTTLIDDLTGSGAADIGGYDPKVDYHEKCVEAGIPITRTATGFTLGGTL